MPRLMFTIATALALAAPAAAPAQNLSALGRVKAHLTAVNTMTARFTQTNRQGRSLTGTLTMKRPGQVRFEYGRGVPMLIVGDGKALTYIDYEVKQVSRWPISRSPLSILLDPNKEIANIARVERNDAQTLLISARDPRRPEFGTISIAFAKIPSAPAGLMLRGWTTIDAQNNRTTIRLDDQRFNIPVADTAFRWTDPRPKGPRK